MKHPEVFRKLSRSSEGGFYEENLLGEQTFGKRNPTSVADTVAAC